MKFGAIDIGTNAARLLIGEVVNMNGSSFVKKISYTRIPLRLGMDVFENGRISERKARAFKKSMLAFKLIAEVFNVRELRACATSAMREASNGHQIREMIERETGLRIEIIDGQEEADIIFSSFLLLEFDINRPFVVIDVGGGSTEVSVFSDGEKINSQSFQVGTIRMLKKKVAPDIWELVAAWLLQNVDAEKKYTVFGTGGNINKIHKLLGKRGDEPIATLELKDLRTDLRSLSIAKRISKYQLRPDRADVILPATQIFLKIIKQLNTEDLYVPRIGLSDGMIHQMHKKHSEKNKQNLLEK